MITATYTIAPNRWTALVDSALAEWSKHIVGTATLHIDLQFDTSMSSLGRAGPGGWAVIGKTADGKPIQLPLAAALTLGHADTNGSDPDVIITVNPNWPWHFGSPETTPAHQYSALSMIVHELGHGLFMTPAMFGAGTPFEVYAAEHGGFSGHHSTDASALMWRYGAKGEGKTITPSDVEAASGSGLPTDGDDTIWLPPTLPSANGFGGHDTAIWLGAYDDFAVALINIEQLELRGKDPFTAHQADIYRLYEAAFGREPDLAGFDWWQDSGAQIQAIADTFVTTPEFGEIYAGSRGEFISALYLNVLDRAPDIAGFDFWMGSGAGDGEMLTAFALSAENPIETVGFMIAQTTT